MHVFCGHSVCCEQPPCSRATVACASMDRMAPHVSVRAGLAALQASVNVALDARPPVVLTSVLLLLVSDGVVVWNASPIRLPALP